jgi:hypothetical protein
MYFVFLMVTMVKVIHFINTKILKIKLLHFIILNQNL